MYCLKIVNNLHYVFGIGKKKKEKEKNPFHDIKIGI